MRVTSISLVLAATIAAVVGVTLPSQDPFYTQPANISQYAPGAVIRMRQVSSNLSGLVPGGQSLASLKALYQILYRTTDNLNNAVAAVTSVLVPENADPNKLLAYQTAYDTTDPDSVPSYAFQSGTNVTEVPDIIFIIAALDKGVYVVSPDYEGLNGHFTEGIIAGQATLDSVRAAFNTADVTGLSTSVKYAAWGYSGGSLASEWAAELQPQYAPELEFQGYALGGLIPNVTNVLLTINGGQSSGLAFSGLTGLSRASPDFNATLRSNLVPSKAAEFFTIGGSSLANASSLGGFKNLFSYFTSGRAFTKNPIFQSLLAKSGVMGVHGIPQAPMFIYKAAGDEVSPVADTTKLVNQFCATNDVTIEYHIDLIGEHLTEAITGSASALAWVLDRLDGKPVSKLGQCTTHYVLLSSASLDTSIALDDVLVAALKALL
ncbi:secretory lipase, partial [Aureobasidium melanogenum]|uniref:Secretory lipase n=1 Tax=Aureobasidium melanogenum (strain CBS 110374) TaxID=1043003 RepID=A0A074VJM6_AURM1